MWRIGLFLVFAAAASAEVHSLTLRQALEIAARQNPDITLARLDEQHANAAIRVAKDPFRPKIYAGSGAAYNYGYPNTIQGSAPSVFQVRTDMALFNKPKSYEIAAAREQARGSQYGVQAKADDVAYQTADLFLTTSQTEHQSDTLSTQIPGLQKVAEAMRAAVSEGSELPLEFKRANLNVAESQQRLEAARLDADYYEMMLAVVLGYPATDRVKPVDSDLTLSDLPASETEAADMAMRNNRQLRQMQSNVLAKEMDLRSYKAARWPQVDVVAQYALFAKYNYENYITNFQKFQYNNYQLGASITLPLIIGTAPKGLATEASIDMQKLRIQMDQLRNRILTDTRRSYQQWEKAKNLRDLARMQLDLAREEVKVRLSQNAEGRLPLSQLEQARIEESNRWMSLFDAEAQVTRSKLAVLRQIGTLMAAVQAAPSAIQNAPLNAPPKEP